jgi:glycine/D-amino acid oxidase-like deaminating enzyme
MKRLYDGRMHGSTEPWWVEEAGREPAAPRLEESIEADVVVVGGGLTGLWSAHAVLQKKPGARVVVLEAAQCGDGASARNGGFLHGYWGSLARLVDVLGEQDAIEVARAADGIIPAVRALGEDVWLEEGGLLLVSASAGQDETVRRAVATAEQLGVAEEARLVPREEVPLHSPVFRDAVRFRDGATVQPARLVRAVRDAALRAGARLYEQTPAVDVQNGRVTTQSGSVRAEEIVVATNAWAARWAPTARRLAAAKSAIVLTEPVPDLAVRIGWEGREAVMDGRRYLSYFRTTNDGRVLMGSATGSTARAEETLRTLFPALADVRVAHRWWGMIDISSDRFPFFGTMPGTRVHYGAGFTGNGVGPSWLGGQLLAALALGEDVQSPLVRRHVPRLPPEPLRSLGTALVSRALLALDEAENADVAPHRLATLVAGLPQRIGLRIAAR